MSSVARQEGDACGQLQFTGVHAVRFGAMAEGSR